VLGPGAATLAINPLGLLIGAPIVAFAEWKKRGLPRGASFFDNRDAQRTLRDDAGILLLDGHRIFDRVRMLPANAAGAPRGALHVRTVYLPPDLPYPSDIHQSDPVDHVVTGPAALRALAVLMARANASGGPRHLVQSAVKHIERARTPADFLARAEDESRKRGAGYRDVWDMPLEIRFAMEMAAHEDSERRAMEGELSELERHWREAESLAAIADALPLSPAVDAKLEALRDARKPPRSMRKPVRRPLDG
jgi:hypothetical protein